MSREIIFRGKQKHDGTWIEGYFSKDYAGIAYITTLDGVSTSVVDEATIGQFTGLTDKNGVKIFEGDVCLILYTDWPSKTDNDPQSLDEYLDSLSHTGVVEYADHSYYLVAKGRFGDDVHMNMDYGKHGRITVIGNSFDNTELIKQS